MLYFRGKKKNTKQQQQEQQTCKLKKGFQAKVKKTEQINKINQVSLMEKKKRKT